MHRNSGSVADRVERRLKGLARAHGIFVQEVIFSFVSFRFRAHIAGLGLAHSAGHETSRALEIVNIKRFPDQDDKLRDTDISIIEASQHGFRRGYVIIRAVRTRCAPWKCGLENKPWEAVDFYSVIATATLLGIGIDLSPLDPISAALPMLIV